jgi:hypothetical protein
MKRPDWGSEPPWGIPEEASRLRDRHPLTDGCQFSADLRFFWSEKDKRQQAPPEGCPDFALQRHTSGKGLELEGKSRLVAGGSVPVKDSSADGVINQGQGWLQQRFRGSLILGLQCRVELSQLVSQLGYVLAIAHGRFVDLFNALKGGLVTCHGNSFG